MIELRWNAGIIRTILEYRTRDPLMDVSHAICDFSEWSEWQKVPTVFQIIPAKGEQSDG